MSSVSLNLDTAAVAQNSILKNESPADKRDYRISTTALQTLSQLTCLSAAYIAFTANPAAAVTGLAIGTLAVPSLTSTQRSEKEQRIESVKDISIMTGLAAFSSIAAAGATGTTLVPGLVGFAALTDGVYPILRRALAQCN